MNLASLTVESNFMALCFMQCSWNTERGDSLGLLIEQCVSLWVFVCGKGDTCLSLEHIITSW